MTRPVLFTGDVFRQQPRGGISRYVIEITRRLARPAEVLLGVHQSALAGELRVPARAGLRLPAFRGAHRVAGLVNPMIDAAGFAARPEAILHPSYYRDPRGLPARSPVVVTVHDMTHERLPDTMPAGGAGDPARHKAALCARADRILCNSETTRRDLLELMRVPGDRVRVAPHAARDLGDVPAGPLPGARAPFLLWVGERHSYKNFLPTLAAWAGARDLAGTQLVCVGGGAFRAHERTTIERLGVAGRVLRRTCPDSQLRWAYEHAAALVYTSLWEGFGVPLLEAMWRGCPVLTSDRAPFREVAADQAVFVEPKDPDALRAGMSAVLARGRTPGEVAARRACAARYSWDTCAAQHEAAYRELD